MKDAANDFRGLDGSVKQQVAKQLIKLENSTFPRDSLGNVNGFNLRDREKITSYSRISFSSAQI